MSLKLKFRRGTKAQLASVIDMEQGMPMYCTDTQELSIATAADAHAPAAIDINAYGALGSVAIDDLIYMYDVSAAADAVKARKITFADFKTALSIPESSTDEKVATVSGATAGYLGTNGTDGILRVDAAGLKMVAGGSDAFVTLGLSFADEAQGDIMYRGASAYARLQAGTAGAFLKTNGASSNPSWETTVDGGSFAT